MTPKRALVVQRYTRRRAERLRRMIGPRICGVCHYAFLSRGGQNVCSPCQAQWILDYCRTRGVKSVGVRRVRVALHADGVPDYLRKPTISPLHAVPDADSPRIRFAIERAFDYLRSIEGATSGYYSMPHLPGIPRYHNPPITLLPGRPRG